MIGLFQSEISKYFSSPPPVMNEEVVGWNKESPSLIEKRKVAIDRLGDKWLLFKSIQKRQTK